VIFEIVVTFKNIKYRLQYFKKNNIEKKQQSDIERAFANRNNSSRNMREFN